MSTNVSQTRLDYSQLLLTNTAMKTSLIRSCSSFVCVSSPKMDRSVAEWTVRQKEWPLKRGGRRVRGGSTLLTSMGQKLTLTITEEVLSQIPPPQFKTMSERTLKS